MTLLFLKIGTPPPPSVKGPYCVRAFGLKDPCPLLYIGPSGDKCEVWSALTGQRRQGSRPRGSTHYLGVRTNCETTAPTFWQWTAPGLPISKFTAPSFDRSSGTAPSNHQLSIFLFCFILPKYNCESLSE